MKFKITITEEVIDKSLMCDSSSARSAVGNCALSVAFTELIPSNVYYSWVDFLNKDGKSNIGHSYNSKEMMDFISAFDDFEKGDFGRYSLVGQQFDVEIPDEVIEYWYGDASKVAQKIIDNPIMQIA